MIHKLLSLIREIFNSTHRDNCQKGKLQPEFQTTKSKLMLPLKWKVTLKQAKSPAKCMNITSILMDKVTVKAKDPKM